MADGLGHSPYDTAASTMPARRDLSSHRSVFGVYEDMSTNRIKIKKCGFVQSRRCGPSAAGLVIVTEAWVVTVE